MEYMNWWVLTSQVTTLKLKGGDIRSELLKYVLGSFDELGDIYTGAVALAATLTNMKCPDRPETKQKRKRARIAKITPLC